MYNVFLFYFTFSLRQCAFLLLYREKNVQNTVISLRHAPAVPGSANEAWEQVKSQYDGKGIVDSPDIFAFEKTFLGAEFTIA